MCGVLLLSGPQASLRLSEYLPKLSHRGPDDQAALHHAEFSLGFTRLAINDQSMAGQQPYRDGDLVSAINGEIFNAHDLIQHYQLELASRNDCHVIAPLFRILGKQLLPQLDGFYAGIIVDMQQGKVFSLRDYIGKKPLFIGRSGPHCFVTSELRALAQVDEFVELPPGLCELDLETAKYRLLAQHAETAVLNTAPLPAVQAEAAILRRLLTEATIKRLPQNQAFGVFLSGGLDSSILASIIAAHPVGKSAHYYCLASPTSPDYRYVQELADFLGLQSVRFLAPPSAQQLDELITATVLATQSFNPSIISNGLGTLLLSRAAQADGLKVVLTGEGADELFGGYHWFDEGEDWQQTRRQLLNDLRQTELRRLDLSCMANSIEARCPFLDRAVFNYAMRLGYRDLYRLKNAEKHFNKFILRAVFENDLPDAIVLRAKTSCDVGSGLRGLVVQQLKKEALSERTALERRWKKIFSAHFLAPAVQHAAYFQAYPVFDDLIDRRGVTHK